MSNLLQMDRFRKPTAFGWGGPRERKQHDDRRYFRSHGFLSYGGLSRA